MQWWQWIRRFKKKYSNLNDIIDQLYIRNALLQGKTYDLEY